MTLTFWKVSLATELIWSINKWGEKSPELLLEILVNFKLPLNASF